jgi:hypothetical protein
MLIFVKPRIVLLSVPKTGTTALEQALSEQAEIAFRGRPEIKHLNLRQYLNRIRPLLSPLGDPPFETVAVIREPMEWLASWYRFRARDTLIGHPNSTVHLPFSRFIEDYLLPGPRPSHARLGRQSEFLFDNDDRIAVDHLFRYEAMPALLEFLGTRLGRTIDLPRVNVSPRAATDLDPGVEKRLRTALAPEYAVWQEARQTP